MKIQFKNINYFKFNILFCLFIFLIFYKFFFKNVLSTSSNVPTYLINSKEKISFDKYEVSKFNKIKEKFPKHRCLNMWGNQREFLNGLIRKFKPKKILEVGVNYGGSSIVMLNAIDDFKDSKLYSIDLSTEKRIGECLYKYFPNLLKKWTLFKGKISTEFIEQIGNNIDMVFFDTSHQEPGEIMDFLMVLPFLKENAIVAFHDIAMQLHSKVRNEFAPYIIFNGIRGEKYLPSGDNILKQDIGAIRLDNNQNKYYQDYFRLLGGQWQYFPKEEHVIQLRNFFTKYYNKDCLKIFEEAISFNRNFVKLNPKNKYYNFVAD